MKAISESERNAASGVKGTAAAQMGYSDTLLRDSFTAPSFLSTTGSKTTTRRYKTIPVPGYGVNS